MLAIGVSLSELERALIVFAVGVEQLEVAVFHIKPVEAAFKNFVRQGKKQSISHGFAVSPIAPIDLASLSEQTETLSVALVVLEVAFVDVTIGKDQLAGATPETLQDLALVLGISYAF